ncbi:interleukin-36 alpha-like [Erythrolamprus reginae]|uniref:interleukin-36 alpha-like n=1 Tax=Erythrolamprus reginae TaxID=121349 RepID=UPI00396CE5EF
MARKLHKMSWDEEMANLFHDFNPETSPATEAMEKPWLFKFWDISNKFLSVENNMLIATPQNSNSPGSSFDVIPNTSLDSKRHPIFIGANNHVLSCKKSGDGQLQIELMEENIMILYRTPEKFKNFTFYSKSDGRPEICTFESAEFPGWFISTSSEANKPTGLHQKGGPENVLFHFTKIS